MNKGRSSHSSCTTSSDVFVFGGIEDFSYLSTIEKMTLNVGQTNCDGNPVNRQWIMLEIPDLTARSIPLLATVNDDAILILGGKRDVEILSDGMLFNPNTMEMISFLTQSSLRFWCAFN